MFWTINIGFKLFQFTSITTKMIRINRVRQSGDWEDVKILWAKNVYAQIIDDTIVAHQHRETID